MKTLNAIDLAVPHFARSNYAVDNPSFPIIGATVSRGCEQPFVALESPHRPRARILAGTAVRAHQIERVPVGEVAAPAALAKAGPEGADVHRFHAEDDVEHAQIRLMAACGALVDDRGGMIALGRERGRGCRILHAFERLRDDDRVAVDRAEPERPPAHDLLRGVFNRSGQLPDLDVHRALHDDRARRGRIACPAGREDKREQKRDEQFHGASRVAAFERLLNVDC